MKVRFGAFELDSATRELFGADGPVHLAPKVFELLSLLLDERPRAVAKADLHRRLWPDTFVSESNLALLVSDLRAALGDTASGSRFIRTVPRFGYAFCGLAVTVGEEPAPRFARWFLVFGAERVPLAPGVSVIGRDPEADIPVKVPGVSRLHARIHVTGVGATIEDLGSKNGTFVRGARIAGLASLHDGDEIRFGLFPMTFCASEPTSTTETLHG